MCLATVQLCFTAYCAISARCGVMQSAALQSAPNCTPDARRRRKKCIADVASSSRDALQVLLPGVLIPDSKPPWESLQQQIVWVERYALGQFGLCWGFMCVLFSWVFVSVFLSLENNDLRHQVLLWSKCGGTSIRTTGFLVNGMSLG